MAVRSSRPVASFAEAGTASAEEERTLSLFEIGGRMLTQIGWLLQQRLATKVNIEGIAVIESDPAAHAIDQALTVKIEEALQIISQYAPTRFSRMQRDVKRIVLHQIPDVEASYSPRRAAVVLDREFVRRRGNAHVALALIHEATHARLACAGFAYTPDRRDRIERICTRAEIALAERLPGSGPELARLERVLRQDALSDKELQHLRNDWAQTWRLPSWILRRMQRRHRSEQPQK